MYHFRKSTKNDIKKLLELRRDFCFEDKHDFDHEGSERIFSEIIGDDRIGEIHVASDKDGIVGYAFFAHTYSIEFNGKDALLDELYIAPDHRAKKLGSKLIEAVVARVKDLGGSYLHLEAMDDNIKAHGYYKSKGFNCRKSKHYVMVLKDGLPSTV